MLTLLQFTEPDVANEIGRFLTPGRDARLLTVKLEGEHSYRFIAEWRSEGLLLHVTR